MLILAGIAIAALSGENGILTRASEAKEKTIQEGEKEQIKLVYNASKSDKLVKGDNTLVASDLQKELDKQNAGASATDRGEKIQVTFNKSGNMYLIDSNGTIEERKLSGEEAKWEEILKEANENPDKYKSSEQKDSKAIAIGTDGNAVNMDLWIYRPIRDDTNTVVAYELYDEEEITIGYYEPVCSYRGSNFENIIIPQYIKDEQDKEFKPVTSLHGTFIGISQITVAPQIPNTVKSLDKTFFGCIGLENAPVIPNSVTDMDRTFVRCIGLNSAPVIPSSVTNMEGTFDGCTGLKEAPIIPSGITSLLATFRGCSGLTEFPKLPESLRSMNQTFEGCSKVKEPPEIPNSVISLALTFKDCTALIRAPEIPSSVENMDQTFENCTALIEAPTIPSSVNRIGSTFRNCSSISGIIVINAKGYCYYTANSLPFEGISNAITIRVPKKSVIYGSLFETYGTSSNIIIEQF